LTRADIPIGLLFVVACLWVLWQASLLPYGSEFAPGSGFAPVWLSLLGLLLSVLLAGIAWLQRDRARPLPESGGRGGLARVVGSLAGMLVMILLVPALGLLPAILAYLTFLSLAVERLPFALGLGVSVGTVAFVHFVFGRFLGVPFPVGPLGF
jgi:hypothetical protein